MNKKLIILLSLIQLIFFSTSFASTCKEDIFSLRYRDTYENALARFINSGGDENDIILIKSINDIFEKYPAKQYPNQFRYNGDNRSEFGYKFGLSIDCELRVSQYEYKHRRTPSRGVNHHLVGHGNEVYSAGAIFFFHDNTNINRVVIANRSSRYCPSYKSLSNVVNYLVDLGISEDKIDLVDDTRRVCRK